jgi:hypothetical protein
MASLPSLSSSEPLLDLAMFDSEIKRKSFMNMDPDFDDLPTGSSISHSDTSRQLLTPFLYSKPGCSSVVSCLAQPDETVTVMRTAPTCQFRSRRVSEDSGLCHTPVLTPDLGSIEASPPSLSEKFRPIDVSPFKQVQDPSGAHTSIVPFKSLDCFRDLPTIPYEESAVAEGTSQDQNIYSCALNTSHLSSASLDSGGNKRPRSRREFPLRGVGGECIAEVSASSIDISQSTTDFTLLAAEWPLPPLHAPSERNITPGDKSDLEVC